MELHSTLLSYAVPYWATLFSSELRSTMRATIHPSRATFSTHTFVQFCQMPECWTVQVPGYPSPAPECYGTGLRCWMPEYQCRLHQPQCQCPAMLFSKENRRKSIQILYRRCKLLAVFPIFYFLHAVKSLSTQGDWLIGVVTRILMHLPMRACWVGLISPTAAEQSWLRYPKGECRGQCSRSGSIYVGSISFWASTIQIWIHLVKGTDPDLDSPVIKQK